MVKHEKRKKRQVPTQPRKLPPPKRIPGGIQQRPYKAEKPGEPPRKHEIPASEIPKGKGILVPPTTAVIKEGTPAVPEEVAKKIQRRNNLIAAAVTIPIVLGVVLLTPYIIWGHAWWEHPWGFGGGAGGAQTWQIASEYGQVATLTVDSSGNFTGTGWQGYAAGIGYYDIYITNGRMSGTSMTFVESASYSGGTISGTGTGTLNGAFPSATYATGTSSGIISDPLGTRSYTYSWTATRQS